MTLPSAFIAPPHPQPFSGKRRGGAQNGSEVVGHNGSEGCSQYVTE